MEINNKYGYVRISSKSQESNSSIESQKQQLIQNGIEEENIFVEVGSEANEIKNRSVFQKLINQKLKEVSEDDPIEETFFYYPLTGMLPSLSAKLLEYKNNPQKRRGYSEKELF